MLTYKEENGMMYPNLKLLNSLMYGLESMPCYAEIIW